MSTADDETTLRRQDVVRLFAEASGTHETGELHPGAKLGAFTLERRLGRGGMGEVWLAGADGEQVAIKVLAASLREDEVSRARFEREARSLATLGDLPGIARLLGLGSTPGGRPYFVMEYVAGARPLSEAIDEGLAQAAALDVIAQAAEALAGAHARGLLHRDVKPSNVLLLPDGDCRLIDFGLVKALGGESQRLTETEEVLGTVAYMAPEQIRGEELGPWTDVFALGATLYKALTGVTPYVGDMATILQGIVDSAPFPRPSEVARVAVPPAVEAVCLRALSHERTRRYPDAGAFAAALREARAASAARGRWGLGIGALGVVALGATLALRAAAPEPAPASPPTPTPLPSAVPAPPTSASPTPAPAPDWFRTLPPARRPPLPLPLGVSFGATSGEYRARDGSTLVWCPPGRFWQGSGDGNPDERPVRRVALGGFFLGKHEVTWGQYRRFCKQTGRVAPSPRITSYSVPFAATDAHPVFRVAWGDAQAYCRWAGLRLPTEAEWEYAARGEDRSRRFPWGATLPRGGPPVANLADRSVEKFVDASWGKHEADYDDGAFFPTPVGRYPRGASPFGCLDMAGNVWEWTASRYGRYGRPPPADGRFRVARGGSWDNSAPYNRSTNRGRMSPDAREVFLGFRVALSPSR